MRRRQNKHKPTEHELKNQASLVRFLPELLTHASDLRNNNPRAGAMGTSYKTPGVNTESRGQRARRQ